MATAEIASKVKYNVSPVTDMMVYVFTFAKAAGGDYFDVATYSPIKSIIYARAQSDAAGADDPLTWSGTTVTFSTSTTDGRVLVIGKGQ